MISQNSISQVLEQANVEDIIDDFVTLKKRGANLIGLCPFHNEKTPSFTVSPTKNLYKCFGCGKGGNAVSFIMEHENYTFPEAIRLLAKRYGIELEETQSNQEDKEKAQEKESLFIINEFAKDFFHQQLLNTDEGKSVGLSYFKNRGLLLSTINEFNLGYSPMDAKALITQAQKKGYKDEFLTKIGLKSKSGLDFFRSRIIFPITNLSGKVIAFGGRTLSKEKKIPKYLNSPESEIYYKSKSLYGIFQAKNQIRKDNNCYLVEGYTDVLNLHQNEVKNVVASSGTSLTNGQLRIIKRFCSTLTFLYDGDSAGKKAAIRGLPMALDEGFDVKIVPIPETEDPDSLMQEMGASSFHEFLKHSSQDFIIYWSKLIKKEYESLPIEKSTAIKELLVVLAHIRDTIKRSIYIKEICSLLNIDEKSAIGELNKNIRKQINNRRKDKLKPSKLAQEESFLSTDQKEKSINTFEKTDYHQEKDLIRILIQDGHKYIGEEKKVRVSDFIIENIQDILDTFKNEDFKGIILEYISNRNNSGNLSISYFLNHQNEKLKNLAIELAESPYTYANWTEKGVELQTQKYIDENFEKDSLQAIRRFRLKKLDLKIYEIINRLSQPNLDSVKEEILIKTYNKITTHRKTLADELGNIVL